MSDGIYHTRRPSGNAGSINHLSSSTTARNFSRGLPKVSGGQRPHPKHINNLSEAVDRTTIRSFTGGLVKQNSNGTTIESLATPSNTPWQVSVQGDYIVVSNGLSHSGYGNFNLKQLYPQSTGQPTIGLFRGGELSLPPNTKSGLDGTTNVYSTGDEKAATFLIPKGDTENGKYLWVDGGMLMWDSILPPAGTKVVIAWVKKNSVVQFINGDLPYTEPPKPFEITVYPKLVGTEVKYYAKIYAGVVQTPYKSVIPTLGGKSLTDPTAEVLINSSTDVYLKMNNSGDSYTFPTSVTVEGAPAGTSVPSTNSAGFLLVGSIILTNGKLSSYSNFLQGSIFAETHKYRPDKWSYYYNGI